MNLAAAEGHLTSPSSSEQRLPPVARPHPVSEVTPAKKITFFKSGDPQFSGVRMAINRRSFKSFSALMDDLSNRVPLPFGVRTITTPRGTHSINRLEQLQDGGSYICSDKKYVQPIAGRKIGTQRTSRPVSARKQSHQQEAEEEYAATHFQQVPKPRKKIVLVKNGDPTIRRSIVLNRRNTRNFRTFLEDASDLLQYTVRRLYTVDGKRIENIQAVLQFPSILLCVGREPFKPLQKENARKSMTEKLPGLRTLQSDNTEVLDNKKNATFGLKAKKSVIHPRSASSNKTRFSLSSEKSYPNGLSMSPVNSGFESYPNACPHEKSEDTGHSIVNDDIEKKVHVNKDGSLSVEMKVRFRLLNEETLQWSTQIKKSSTFGKAKCEKLCSCDENGQKRLNHKTFSETDESFYPCDADSYTSKLNDAELVDMYCTQCGMQCQDYDIWKNPMHANQQEHYVKRSTWQTRSSASSTSSHHKFIGDQRTSVDSLHTMSSEEYTEHIVHQSSHYSGTRENGETMVRYSSVSRCTNCSGQSTPASNIDVISESGCKKSGNCPNKSCSSLKDENSLQNQHSHNPEGHPDHKSCHNSFEESIEASPTPCTDGENCSRRSSIISQSSQQSKSQKRRLKRNSTNTKSFRSNISYNEEEEKDEASGRASLKNLRGMSTETDISKDHFSDECSQQSPNDVENSDDQSNYEQISAIGNLETSHIDDGQCSRGTSPCSTSSSKEKASNQGLADDQVIRNSPYLFPVSKQNSESILYKQGSLDICENTVQVNRSTSSKSKRKSYSENHEPSIQSSSSHQSVLSVTKSVLTSAREEEQILNNQLNCDKSLKTHHINKSEDLATSTSDEDGQACPPISRSSSQYKSFNTKPNYTDCRENDKIVSDSSRVSSVSENKSEMSSSSEKSEQKASKVIARETSEEDGKHNGHAEGVDFTTTTIYSPSPPKGKPGNGHLRSTQFKYSNASIGSDLNKTTNEEKPNSSRSSTPGLKEMSASRGSTETCKNTKKVVAAHDSMEEIQNNKLRKNSSSSSKRKLKGGSLDVENKISSELIPSALPNVTPEEVVNEWLRKIPSQTMAVEYEMEECQKKVCIEVENETSKTDMDKRHEDEELSKDSVADIQKSDQLKEDLANGESYANIADNTPDTNNCVKRENEDFELSNTTNNVRSGSETAKSTSITKLLPNNVQTSVQIMKALLSPSQESKCQRSNSLPEVSQVMGRKLSNSATILISCLASLKLLDDGQTNPTKNSNDLSKHKYVQLVNIFQALWAEDPSSKTIASMTSGKYYIREDEVTPVSSSGVDINSGFGGSGDGSLTGGGDSTMIAENKLSMLTNEVKFTSKNIENCAQEPVTAVDQDTGNTQLITSEVSDACFKECVMDENMNEKKMDNSDNNLQQTVKNEHGNSDTVNNINDEGLESLEKSGICNSETMNILNHTGNSPKSNSKSNSQETNYINSPSKYQSTGISTSDSNGETEQVIDKQTYESDPVWVLKLLKKIEKEFMTHYVDAMNEFKVRWNLENNENLDEMIAELKNEVSQRIERSISNELKRIQSKASTKAPRPPDGPRRKSSLQAEERRRRLQTMHRRSNRPLESRDNKEWGTNYLSCETDEEDLTFSASFGDDSNGLANGEFCPCEKCIMQKRALKLAKPRVIVADAPIIKAFDLQEILKMKRMNNENNDEVVTPWVKECARNVALSLGNEIQEDPGEGHTLSTAGDDIRKATCDVNNDSNDLNGHEDKSTVDECEEVSASDYLKCNSTQEKDTETVINPKMENESTECLDDDIENANSGEMDKRSISIKVKEMSVEWKTVDQATGKCENERKSEEEHNSEEELVDHTQQITNNDQETETSESDDEPAMSNENFNEEEGDHEKDIKTLDSSDSYFQKTSLAQASIITQKGSIEGADEDFKEVNNHLEETSPNGHSNSSNSKQSQMYPESSSEDEDRDSPCASPAENTDQTHVNNNGSPEECDEKSKKDLDVDMIDQDDLDF